MTKSNPFFVARFHNSLNMWLGAPKVAAWQTMYRHLSVGRFPTPLAATPLIFVGFFFSAGPAITLWPKPKTKCERDAAAVSIK